MCTSLQQQADSPLLPYSTPNNGQHNARRGSGYMPFPSTEPISAYPPIEVGMPSFRLDPDNPGSASDNDSMDLDEEARQPSLKPETLAEQEVGSSSAYSAAGSAAAPETFEPDIGERIKRHRRSGEESSPSTYERARLTRPPCLQPH